eukprot:TRINITY_DN2927_c1_g1::TRINITY_DN2927_c1_g1_i1::g.4626::m.4626 TRINITY_DN2927_c1_g1::TRINITY_DN2927_c1_g1_i1::g.4626  ORF type:complete len:282 (+),score=69.18,sp/A6QQ07/BTD_BOVIN/33.45/1e-34,CN_hydrolase/PF00795.17/8.1e-11,DUF2482/PF10655.4/0.2,DUF2482/PF10655.4/1e+04 TRINITY_DN2927_c1_g1_i1:36-881(+)
MQFFFALIALVGLLAPASASYIAAVAHHVSPEGPNPQEIISKNLELFELHTEIAKANNVDILVFPEFSIGGDFNSREGVLPFTEIIPEVHGNPCAQGDLSTSRVSVFMSCLARKYEMYIATNIYDIKPCPSDGCPKRNKEVVYNTEVVFAPNGDLVAKYYKAHPFFVRAFDTPPVEHVTFKTPFATFGIFVCFDIMFQSPAVDLVEQGVEHFIYSVAMDAWAGTQVHAAWSKRYSTVMLASNYGEKWSGVYENGDNLTSKTISLGAEYPNEALSIALVERD